MSKLTVTIADVTPIDASLLLVHTTDAYRFESILTTKTITPADCPVFNEKLLYLFYGRPAYRTRKQANENLFFDLPVVIVLSPDAELPPPTRVFPFDTGAFAAGKYKSYFHPDTPIEDLSLDNSIESILRYISFMYRNMEEYYDGATRKNVNIEYNQFEAAGLHELAKTPANPIDASQRPPDERSSSIEIQIGESVSISKPLALIVPQVYLDDKNMTDAISSIDAKYLKSYPVMSRMGSDFIAGTIYQILRTIYAEEGLM